MDSLRQMLTAQGLNLLDLAAPDWLPGHLLHVTYFGGFLWWNWEVRLDADHGLATDLVQAPPLSLDPREPSNIVIENANDTFGASGGVGIPQFGLNAATTVSSDVEVTWNISAVETITIGDADVQRYYNTVLPQTRAWAKLDPQTRSWVMSCYLVEQVFFATTITGTIKAYKGVTGQGIFDIHGISVQPNFTCTWADDDTFTIQGSSTVPFACRGDFIKV